MISDIFYYIASIIALPAMILGLYKFKSLPPYLKTFVLLVTFKNTVELANAIFSELGIFTYINFHIFLLGSIVFYGILLTYTVKKKLTKSTVILISEIVLTYALYNSIFIDQFYKGFNFNIVAIQAVSTIFISLICLFEIFLRADHVQIARFPIFWMINTILIYNAGALFNFIFNKEISAIDSDIWVFIMAIHNSIFGILSFVTVYLGVRNITQGKMSLNHANQ